MINFTTVAATFVLTASASAGIVTFDNINPPAPTDQTISPGVQLTMDVDGFTFSSTNTYYGNRQWYYYTYCPAVANSDAFGYNVGIRGTTAVFSGYYQTAAPSYNVSRSDGSLWAFNKACFTAAWGPGLIHLVGLRGGFEVFNFTQSISDTQQTWASPFIYPGTINWIDTLKITNDLGDPYQGRRHFIMDDMFYTLPAPGAFALMGCGLIGIRSRRRMSAV